MVEGDRERADDAVDGDGALTGGRGVVERDVLAVDEVRRSADEVGPVLVRRMRGVVPLQVVEAGPDRGGVALDEQFDGLAGDVFLRGEDEPGNRGRRVQREIGEAVERTVGVAEDRVRAGRETAGVEHVEGRAGQEVENRAAGRIGAGQDDLIVRARRGGELEGEGTAVGLQAAEGEDAGQARRSADGAEGKRTGLDRAAVEGDHAGHLARAGEGAGGIDRDRTGAGGGTRGNGRDGVRGV